MSPPRPTTSCKYRTARLWTWGRNHRDCGVQKGQGGLQRTSQPAARTSPCDCRGKKYQFRAGEELKKDPKEQPDLLPLVQPVMEKVGSIINRHIARRNVKILYLVGGTCEFPGMAQVIQDLPALRQWFLPIRCSSPLWGLQCKINIIGVFFLCGADAQKKNTKEFGNRVIRMGDQFQLRCYSYIDRMQPQYAAFVGTITQGDLPTEGMAALYIEVAQATRYSGWWISRLKLPRPTLAPRSWNANSACSKCIRTRNPKCWRRGGSFWNASA